MDGLNLPQGFINSLAPVLSGELQDFLHTYEQPYHRALRLNIKGFANADLLDEVAWESKGRYIKNESTLGASILHEAGCFYIQEPSAMVPVAVLAPKPGEWVLDLCAAPGGKATQIAAYLQGEGLLVANEPNLNRAKILAQNLERMGVQNSICVCAMPDLLAAKWPQMFDAVLVDAPCSGEGMFRRHPETRAEWQPDSPNRCAARQKEILSSAIAMLKTGGRLCYSTCTLNRVENEEIISWLCENYPQMKPVPFALAGGIHGASGMCKLWPHKIKGEGHFVALLQKQSAIVSAAAPRMNMGLPTVSKVEIDFPLPVRPTAILRESLVYLPEFPDLSGVKVLRAGLHLGQLKGKIFVPDHALKMAQLAVARIDLSEAEAKMYLRGESIQRDLKGWLIAAYEGHPLGFVKASDGQLKNHYPKGLRKKLDR